MPEITVNVLNTHEGEALYYKGDMGMVNRVEATENILGVPCLEIKTDKGGTTLIPISAIESLCIPPIDSIT